MTTDLKNREGTGGKPKEGTAGRQDALDNALDTLQGILEQHHGILEAKDRGHPDTAAKKPEPLPLLEEVIIPGADAETDETELLPEEEEEEPSPPPLESVPPYADLLNRLASELDIIIESCVDEALAQAKHDLLVKIKNHLDIVLPEILDELTKRKV